VMMGTLLMAMGANQIVHMSQAGTVHKCLYLLVKKYTEMGMLLERKNAMMEICKQEMDVI